MLPISIVTVELPLYVEVYALSPGCSVLVVVTVVVEISVLEVDVVEEVE